MALPGVKLIRTLSDGGGQLRLLLHYAAPRPYLAPSSGVSRLTIETREVEATAGELVEVPAAIEAKSGGGDIKLAMQVTDEAGGVANLMDTPLVGVRPLDDGRYKLQFVMIQPGNWLVYFADPASGMRLNSRPLKIRADN